MRAVDGLQMTQMDQPQMTQMTRRDEAAVREMPGTPCRGVPRHEHQLPMTQRPSKAAQLALPLDRSGDGSLGPVEPDRLVVASPELPAARAAPRFVRHRRARRYILRVLEDGSLRVTLPRWGSKKEALAFVHESADWIARQRALRRVAPRTTYFDEPALRARAGAEPPDDLRALARRHGICVTRVSIRNQRSRWGACSAKGVITLNWRLLLVPAFVREYVMLHELMHRRELNHSRKFWRLVAAACPRYQEARRWLLREGQALF